MSTLAQFHFLRPGWLLLLLPAAFIVFRALKDSDPAAAWRGVMAPHLLAALALEAGTDTSHWRPARVLALAFGFGTLALAGPSWEREPAPFAQDQAAVFLVVKVTPSMLAQDIQPSRLERTVQKVSDFLALRPGQKTGLIAYAGTAHLAMPLTTDPDIINTFTAALTPDAMPEEGDDLTGAIALANERLARSGGSGSIVLFTDDVTTRQVEALRTMSKEGAAPLHVLAIAGGPDVVPPPGSPPALPRNDERLQAAARAGGGDLVLVTPDDSDVQALAANVEKGIQAAPSGEHEQWKDMGWWLLFPLALLLLMFFRPGGGVVLQ